MKKKKLKHQKRVTNYTVRWNRVFDYYPGTLRQRVTLIESEYSFTTVQAVLNGLKLKKD